MTLFCTVFCSNHRKIIKCQKIYKNVLGEERFDKFMKEKDLLQLDDPLEGFFKKCDLVNYHLETKGLFLRVYERRIDLDTSQKKVRGVKIISFVIFHHV